MVGSERSGCLYYRGEVLVMVNILRLLKKRRGILPAGGLGVD